MCPRVATVSAWPQLPSVPPPARRHPGLRRRGRRVDRAGVRRPGVPAHRGRRPGGHAAALPGRRAGGVDVLARGRGGGLRRRRGRWVRAAADLVGRRALPRLDAVGRRARPDLGRAAARPVDLGVGRPGRRRRPAASRARAAVRPGAVRRLARACCWPRPGRSSRRGGSATAAGRPRSCGGTPTAPAGSSGCSPGSTPSSSRRCRSGERLAFLSDHEGWGNLYSRGPRRAATCAGTPTTAAPARPRSTCGTRAPTATRVVYESAGELWILDVAGRRMQPRRLDVRLGGPRTAREPHRDHDLARGCRARRPTGRAAPASCTVRGTVHRLTHRDGPARTLLAEPGVRARLAEPLGDDLAVWVDDADGEDGPDRRPDGPARRGRAAAGPVRGRRAGCCSWPPPRTAAASP